MDNNGPINTLSWKNLREASMWERLGSMRESNRFGGDQGWPGEDLRLVREHPSNSALRKWTY